jgi:hypothetical protein
VAAFYSPGLVPKDYKSGASLPVLASALDSPDTHIPYDLYKDAGYCDPVINQETFKLGDALTGEKW